MKRWELVAMAGAVIVGVSIALALLITALVTDAEAQAPATQEPERWEDPEYPVACYRSPGDVSWSCVALPYEEEEVEEGPNQQAIYSTP
jgi:hypothetical protein